MLGSGMCAAYNVWSAVLLDATHGSTALVDHGRFFKFLNIYTVCRFTWTGDKSFARQLLTHGTIQTQNICMQISIPQLGFETTIPVS
jgi:hypothetical protein